MADIRLQGLEMTIQGRQFPDANDFWDGNSLIASAKCEDQGASVSITGSFVRLTELAQWLTAVETMQKTLKGSADLKTIEPLLRVQMQIDKLGHIKLSVNITPDHLGQAHRFDFSGLDQSDLPVLIGQLKAILERFPVKGKQRD